MLLPHNLFCYLVCVINDDAISIRSKVMGKRGTKHIFISYLERLTEHIRNVRF